MKLKYFSILILLILFLLNPHIHAQTDISIDLIKDETIELASNYETIIQNQDGWQYYAIYHFSNDTIEYPKTTYHLTFYSKGNMNLKWGRVYDKYDLKGKYKIRNGDIYFWFKGLLNKEKRKITITSLYFGSRSFIKKVFHKKDKLKWKIIKANKGFIIFEENDKGIKKRIVLIKKE